MTEKSFEAKFLYLLPAYSGQIATAIFPESSLKPEGFFLSNFQIIISKQLLVFCGVFQGYRLDSRDH